MKRIIGLALTALAALSLTAAPALADNASIVAYQPTTLHFGNVDATANYTNATVTPSDIAAATITVPLTKRPITGNSQGAAVTAQFYRACYTADAGKATATTGTITLLVNGSSVAAAARTIGVIRGSLTACWMGARPTASSFIIKLQGVSGDTNVFTVYNAQLTVEILQFN